MKLKTTTIASAAACLTVASAFGQSEAAPEIKPKSLWQSSAGLGLTLTKGNSDTLVAAANIGTTRKGDKNEWAMGILGTYGENDGVKNAESLSGFVQYNRLFTERFYGYARVDGLYDAMADIDYRFTVGPGVGYYFIKTDRTKLSAEVGPAWVIERIGSDQNDYFTIRFAERFEHKFSDTARIWEAAEFLPQVDDWGNYVINAELGVESSLSKALSLRVVLIDNYRSEPAPGFKENDVKLIAGVQYKF